MFFYTRVKYILFTLITFLISYQTIKVFLGDLLLKVGININSKNILISSIISLSLLILFYSLTMKEKKIENFEDDEDIEEDEEEDNEEDEDIPKIVERDIEEDIFEEDEDIEEDESTQETTVNVLGEDVPIQMKMDPGKDNDTEIQEITRLMKENQELKKNSKILEYAMRKKLEKAGVKTAQISNNEIIKEYEAGDKVEDKTQKKHPYLLLKNKDWVSEKNYYDTGCMKPMIKDELFDITDI